MPEVLQPHVSWKRVRERPTSGCCGRICYGLLLPGRTAAGASVGLLWRVADPALAVPKGRADKDVQDELRVKGRLHRVEVLLRAEGHNGLQAEAQRLRERTHTS